MYNIYEQKTKNSEKILLASFFYKTNAVAYLRARAEYYLFSDESFPYYLSFETEF